MKLNQTETELLLAIIDGTADKLKRNNRLEDAVNSLKEKGFLRCNKYHMLEVALCDDYFKQRGYM